MRWRFPVIQVPPRPRGCHTRNLSCSSDPQWYCCVCTELFSVDMAKALKLSCRHSRSLKLSCRHSRSSKEIFWELLHESCVFGELLVEYGIHFRSEGGPGRHLGVPAFNLAFDEFTITKKASLCLLRFLEWSNRLTQLEWGVMLSRESSVIRSLERNFLAYVVSISKPPDYKHLIILFLLKLSAKFRNQ